MKKKMPDNYKNEFRSRLASLTRSRVRLLTFLTLLIYFLATSFSIIIEPESFSHEEIYVWVALIVASAVALYLNKRARTIVTSKVNAYLFILVLLALLTKLSFIYYTYVEMSSSLYLFALLLIAFTVPWKPIEVLPIAGLHLLAYSILFIYVKRIAPQLDIKEYYDGIFFISMGLLLSYIIRKSEYNRDIENFLLLKEVEEKNNQMRRELELATRVHKTLMPKSISTDSVDIAVTYLPMYYIGGDYAKFHFVDKDRFLFIICDVTGHGVSAALIVNRLHTEFERLVREGKEPGLLLRELNNFIIMEFGGLNMYLSGFCGMLNFKNMKFLYSNYGHPDQYLYRITNADIERLHSQASLLGLSAEDKVIYQKEIGFEKGDKILLFTDGIVEARDSNGEEFGEDRIESAMKKHGTLSVELLNQELVREAADFSKKDFEDDIFVLSFYIK